MKTSNLCEVGRESAGMPSRVPYTRIPDNLDENTAKDKSKKDDDNPLEMELAWEQKFSIYNVPYASIKEIQSFGENILKNLKSSVLISSGNSERISQHLIALAEVENKHTGSSTMMRYFFVNLPKFLDGEDTAVVQQIRRPLALKA